MAMAAPTATAFSIPRFSATLAFRPRCRASLSSDHHAQAARYGSEDSRVDNACISSNASTAVPVNDGVGIGRRGVVMAAAASAMLLFAVEDSKGEIHAKTEPGSQNRKIY